MKDKIYRKVRGHCDHTRECRDAAHSIYNLKNSVPKKVPIVFHNGSNYDYHFIIKELAEEFKKLFTCLGENAEKDLTFTIPIEKEVIRIDKNGEEIIKNISYILQFIDSTRFMASSLSNLIKILSKFIELNVNMSIIIKNVKLAELNINIATVFLNRQTLKLI